MHLNRRKFICHSTALTAGLVATPLLAAEAKKAKGPTLGFSTYALPGVSSPQAVRKIADIGYDSVELCVFPPTSLPEGDERQSFDESLRETGLKLTSLMENLNPLSSAVEFRAQTDRLKRVCDFARSFESQQPLIQTILGANDWEKDKEPMRDRLGAWQEIVVDAGVTLAIKPHRGHAMSTPARAIWLINELGDSPRLRMCYDYSHFIFRDMPLTDTIRQALPYVAHVAVKDAIQVNGKVEFQSPGESGTIDYASLIKQFVEGGYRGDFCVEVSSQVWRQPDYDPDATLKSCYQTLAQAFKTAKVDRI